MIEISTKSKDYNGKSYFQKRFKANYNQNLTFNEADKIAEFESPRTMTYKKLNFKVTVLLGLIIIVISKIYFLK